MKKEQTWLLPLSALVLFLIVTIIPLDWYMSLLLGCEVHPLPIAVIGVSLFGFFGQMFLAGRAKREHDVRKIKNWYQIGRARLYKTECLVALLLIFVWELLLILRWVDGESPRLWLVEGVFAYVTYLLIGFVGGMIWGMAFDVAKSWEADICQ